MLTIYRRAILLCLLFSACTSGGESGAPPAMSEARMDAVATNQAPGEANGFVAPASAPMPAPARVEQGQVPDAAADPSAMPAMIIRTGQASIEVDSLEVAIARVEALARQVGAFVANTQVQAGQDQMRTATLEIRVPAARFDDLVHGLAPVGKLEYVNISAQDVGEEFTDVTARVANARRLEGRLIELLATRTGKLSDVLEIERELARVREEIERMEGRLRYLKAHVATSTLSITVHEPAPVVGDTGSGGVIADAFRDAWRNFVHFVAGLIASMGVLIPAGALLVAGLLGLRWFWRRRHD
ncbi:MAG TPA: DUF4349 domain-containing protein [Gemmatimonadales bacterium]|nr:DUF4349 domain-containing protein [Gemmatimonadales bacterium]